MKKLYSELEPNVVMRSLMKSETRMEYKVIRGIYGMDLETSEHREQAFQRALAKTSSPRDMFALRLLWSRSKGDNFFKAGDYMSAIDKLQETLRMPFNGEAKYLQPEFYNSDYITQFQPLDSWRTHMDLAVCCGGTAQSYVELGDLCKALDWLGEHNVLYGCLDLRFANKDETYKTLRYFTSQMKIRLEHADTFTKLGNTASAAYYAEKVRIYTIPEYLAKFTEVIDLNNASRCCKCLWIRHPDLSIADDWNVKDPSLQVRGIWNKLSLLSNYHPCGRRGNAAWLWHSKLYVFGGIMIQSTTFEFRPTFDIWSLDLKGSGKWRKLPDVPENLRFLGLHARSAVLYNNYAWLFTGQRDILRFNMTSESWDYVITEMSDSGGRNWPYIDKGLIDASIALLDHYMYVFGGDLHLKQEGSDIFMVLDLDSLQWRYLGDSSLFKRALHPGKHWPSRRRCAGCWIVPNEKRFYLMYGHSEANDISDMHENDLAYDPYCSDLWSYCISDGVWVRERLNGNYFCPREDMGITYHAELNAVIVFGGCSLQMRSYSSIPPGVREGSYNTQEDPFPDLTCNFFGDTFIMDMSLRRWRQIVTRSFPCWSSGARCLVDESTNDIYLYGGSGFKEYINREALTTKHPTIKGFTGIYRLEIDFPGSSFEMEKFLVGSMNYLKFGKWRRCYNCKIIGKEYFKCQGSCGGRYVFCSVECQRKAWKEHKSIHGCRKILLAYP